jgi:AcrR family transcriptional regulator
MSAAAGATRLPGSTRDRLAAAAAELFRERGYEATTIEDIAARAGVGRRTFFRSFRTKDEVVFPHHDEILAAIERRFAALPDEPAIDAVCAAARLILAHYVETREISVERYRLIGQVPTLREREMVSTAAYQHLFRTRLAPAAGAGEAATVRAEVFAAAVAAAHNLVLRTWLREGGKGDPFPRLDAALDVVRDIYARCEPGSRAGAAGPALLVLALDDATPTEAIAAEIDRVRRARRSGGAAEPVDVAEREIPRRGRRARRD